MHILVAGVINHLSIVISDDEVDKASVFVEGFSVQGCAQHTMAVHKVRGQFSVGPVFALDLEWIDKFQVALSSFLV